MTITSRHGTAVAIAGIVAGATAAVAVAVPPPPSSQLTGDTSQTAIRHHGVEVDTDAAGHVSPVYIQWQAKCKAKGKFWTSTTKIANKNGIPQQGDVFKLTHSYTANAGGGIKGRITFKLAGQFTDNDNANGTWSAKVIVKRHGKKIDSCKTPRITWTAARAA